MEIIKMDEAVEKVQNTTIPSSEKKSWFETLKSYLIVYRNTRDIMFTLYAALWFLFCTYVVSLANSYADRTNTNVINDNDDDYVAPDVILKPAHQFYLDHDWIPRGIADILVYCTCTFIIIRAITLKCYSLTVARRILLVMGFVYLLRACFIPLTVLPTPWVSCKRTFYDNIFYDALMLEFQLRVACGDVFFSIDVLCAFIFSSLAWIIYHWAVKVPQLGGTWWGTIINYIDDPFYYDHDTLPIAYERVAPGPSNDLEIANLNLQNFDVADNSKDLESGHNESPINDIALIYEQQRKNLSQNNPNISGGESELTGEEIIYKRKSVLSDTSIDNISNVNLSIHSNNTKDMEKEVVKKEQFLKPTYGSKMFKHHSLASLSSNNSENTNIPNLLIKNSSNNLSIKSGSSSSNNLCIGNPLTQSPTMSPVSPTISVGSLHKKDSQKGSMDSYSSLNSKNSKSVVPGQNISPIQTIQKPELSNSGNISENNSHNGVTQFKTNSPEAFSVQYDPNNN
ncbi:hypothetical protein PIROE2DRAFT_2320 [Piromyces sp. E2]|nr:hypothetical protein PIROE2DRAFT_2320 [Piromyces sp. E2]|eukprot:OUM69689.1 hypothetical protein PIROE2DRAFT_2320 [Piromyces sp. E2]